MTSTPRPPVPGNPAAPGAGVNSDPVGPVDDFAEFLTDSYRPLLAALGEREVTATVERGGSGHYLLVVDTPAGRVEITDRGRPLPPAETDVKVWLATTAHTTLTIPGDLPIDEVADRIVQFLP